MSMKFEFISVPSPTRASLSDWTSSTWQMKNSLRNREDFENYFTLSSEEKLAFEDLKNIFQVRVTPYYAQLASLLGEDHPLRKILMPHQKEFVKGIQEMLDPLGERQLKNNPKERVVHRYSDRCLLLLTDFCSVYCRYCTRKHFTGAGASFLSSSQYEEALTYIRSHTGMREVILSGGDPLTLSTEKLDQVLFDLRKIEHIEIIRMASRQPVVLPFRMDEDLAKVLRKHKPVYLMTHFNHPKELSEEAAVGLERCVDHGIPVMNQMVLLNGVNNHAAIVQALNRRLLFLRVKPYYMFQCDPSIGTDHFRTRVEDSISIQRELWGHLSGLAMSNLSLDIPEGGGKVGLVPNFEVHRDIDKRVYRGWDGVEWEYRDPHQPILKPSDFEEYLGEWNSIKNAKK